MTENSPDASASIPDLWPSDLTLPRDTPDPHLGQEIICPECHRAFKQVGALKRNMKRSHDIPCESDDIYDPLRDTWNGRPICNHYTHSFVDFYRLRDHINRRICTSFNPAQESITSIVARPECTCATSPSRVCFSTKPLSLNCLGTVHFVIIR